MVSSVGWGTPGGSEKTPPPAAVAISVVASGDGLGKPFGSGNWKGAAALRDAVSRVMRRSENFRTCPVVCKTYFAVIVTKILRMCIGPWLAYSLETPLGNHSYFRTPWKSNRKKYVTTVKHT